LSGRIAPTAVAPLLHPVPFTPGSQAQGVGNWSAAVSVDPHHQNGVHTAVNDGCPIEAPDGQMRFIATDRVAASGLDLWVTYRHGEGEQPGHRRPQRPHDLLHRAAADLTWTPAQRVDELSCEDSASATRGPTSVPTPWRSSSTGAAW
jgi:hypothetical protein